MVPLQDCGEITAAVVLIVGPLVPVIVYGAEVVEHPAASETVSVYVPAGALVRFRVFPALFDQEYE
jgi:hypothetical protein